MAKPSVLARKLGELRSLQSRVRSLRTRAQLERWGARILIFLLSLILILAVAYFYDYSGVPEILREIVDDEKRLSTWFISVILFAMAGTAAGLIGDARSRERKVTGIEVQIERLTNETNKLKINQVKLDFAYPRKVLKLGNPAGKSVSVAKLQLLLSECGHQTNIDGYFGKHTMEAVIGCQKKLGIKPSNGEANKKTWEALLQLINDVAQEARLVDGLKRYREAKPVDQENTKTAQSTPAAPPSHRKKKNRKSTK